MFTDNVIRIVPEFVNTKDMEYKCTYCKRIVSLTKYLSTFLTLCIIRKYIPLNYAINNIPVINCRNEKNTDLLNIFSGKSQ